MKTGLFGRAKALAATALTALLVASAPAHAIPTLTTDAINAGFTLSQFADGFPVTSTFCCGPLGIAFLPGGGVAVSDYPGNVRIFPTDTDGQHAGSFAPAANYGSGNGTGLTRVGNFLYMAEQNAGKVVRLNLDGTFNSDVATGIPSATGIFANSHTGKLYVSDCCSNTGIWEVDPVANTKTQFKNSGGYDGLSISGDGSTLYAEFGGHILGYKLSDGSQVFDSGFFSDGADGTELGAGTLAGKIYVNTNGGNLWEVSLADPLVRTLLVTGGTRGDFVTADPNGSLLFTQSADIWRLTPKAGGCIGANCNVPEPRTASLLALAFLAAGGIGRRRARR